MKSGNKSVNDKIILLYGKIHEKITQHISAFFSLASIKKPYCILINFSIRRDILLTKTQNGMQR